MFAPEQACSRRRKCHIWYIVCTPVYLRESVGVVLLKRTHYAQRNSMLSRFDYFLPFVVEGFSAVHYNKRFPNYFQFFFSKIKIPGLMHCSFYSETRDPKFGPLHFHSAEIVKKWNDRQICFEYLGFSVFQRCENNYFSVAFDVLTILIQ